MEYGGLWESSAEGREAVLTFSYNLPHCSSAQGHQHHCVNHEVMVFWQQKWKWVVGVPNTSAWTDNKQGENFLIWETSWSTVLPMSQPPHFHAVTFSLVSRLPHCTFPFHPWTTFLLSLVQNNTVFILGLCFFS